MSEFSILESGSISSSAAVVLLSSNKRQDQPSRGNHNQERLRVQRDTDPVYKIAWRRKELFGACRLVYEQYLRSGLIKPNPFGMRVTPYHLSPTTEVFAAIVNQEIICTMALVRDGPMGLPMESIYGEEVAACRARGAALGEVSCLAGFGDETGGGVHSVIGLMSLMAQCAKQRGVDELLITVHPRHVKFYERFAGFQRIGDEKTYHAVNDHPAVALAVDLNNIHISHPRAHKRFFGCPFPEQEMRYRPIPEAVLADLRRAMGPTAVPQVRPDATEPVCGNTIQNSWQPSTSGVSD